MKEKPKDLRRCFKCGRDLGPQLEWKKMDTEAGPICYVCFNDAASESRKAPTQVLDRSSVDFLGPIAAIAIAYRCPQSSPVPSIQFT